MKYTVTITIKIASDCCRCSRAKTAATCYCFRRFEIFDCDSCSRLPASFGPKNLSAERKRRQVLREAYDGGAAPDAIETPERNDDAIALMRGATIIKTADAPAVSQNSRFPIKALSIGNPPLLVRRIRRALRNVSLITRDVPVQPGRCLLARNVFRPPARNMHHLPSRSVSVQPDHRPSIFLALCKSPLAALEAQERIDDARALMRCDATTAVKTADAPAVSQNSSLPVGNPPLSVRRIRRALRNVGLTTRDVPIQPGRAHARKVFHPPARNVHNLPSRSVSVQPDHCLSIFLAPRKSHEPFGFLAKATSECVDYVGLPVRSTASIAPDALTASQSARFSAATLSLCVPPPLVRRIRRALRKASPSRSVSIQPGFPARFAHHPTRTVSIQPDHNCPTRITLCTRAGIIRTPHMSASPCHEWFGGTGPCHKWYRRVPVQQFCLAPVIGQSLFLAQQCSM